jgi:hypothetical protein
MTIQFNLQFNISSSVFIATAEKSELSFHQGLAERLMNHLLLCHNVSVFDAERRGW